MKVTQLCLTRWPHGLYSPWNSLGQNTEVGFPSSVDLPDPGIKPGSPALQADSLPTELSEPVSTPILSMRPQGLEKVKLSVPCHPLREELELKHRRACMYAKSFQSCPTLCDLMDYSPPGSSVHGILQARILKWVAVSEPLRKSPTQMSDPISSLCLYFHPPPSKNHLSELSHWSIPQDGCTLRFQRSSL